MRGHTDRQAGFEQGDTATSRPEGIEDCHLEFLDNLRESGITNMFGARPYIVEEFNLSDSKAAEILGYWMKSFGKSDR